MAINAGVTSTAAREGKIDNPNRLARELMADSKALTMAVRCIRETLKTVSARGVDLKKYNNEIFPYKIPARLVIAFLVSLFCIYISQYVHEYIHAFTMPKEIKKQIYVMPQNQMLFVYVEEPVSKKAFMISVLSPAFILGIIPFVIWMFVAPMIPIPVSLGVVMYCIFMSGCALGDYLNAFNCARQVPKGGKVFNRGWHSYWIL